MDGVVYLKKTDENTLNRALALMAAEDAQLLCVVPKIESEGVGLTRTVGLWLFWRKP